MKINIKNLGPIKEFDFDLNKDLHLLYGKSGVGKSYAVYCIFIILKKLIDKDSFRFSASGGSFSTYNYPKESLFYTINGIIVQELKEEKSKKINITRHLQDFISSFLDETFVRSLQNAFLNTYPSPSSLRNIYNISESSIITITLEYISFSIGLSNDNGLSISQLTLKKGINISHEFNTKIQFDEYFIFINEEEEFSYKNGYRSVEAHSVNLLGDITNIIIKDLIQEVNDIVRGVYFLPASRSGLYQGLNSLTPIIAQLSKHRFQLRTTKIDLPSLSEPLADYFLNLSSISSKNLNNEKLQNIANLIETQILDGKVEYDEENSKIFYIPNNTNLKLEMSQSSSMVAELSPIITFLKHIINITINNPQLSLFSLPEEKLVNDHKKYDIIFIEEPEAHMHPESQIKLMEIFTELSKHNIKLIMTSHSNYMFDKLYNLLLQEKISADTVETYHMIMTNEGSIVNPAMHVTKDGIEDENFLKVSEDLFEERMRIYDEKNQELDNAS